MNTSTQKGREARMRQLEQRDISNLQSKVKKNRNLSAILQDKTGSGDNIPGISDPFDYPTNK